MPKCMPWLVLGISTYLGLGLACKPQANKQAQTHIQQSSLTTPPKVTFNDAFRVMSNSCMPCHNKATLPQVIKRVEEAQFKTLGGETRKRLLGELKELQNYMKEGVSLSFTSEAEVLRFFETAPAEFYIMLEKGLMSPPWAAELLHTVKWPNYVPLTTEDRIILLQYSKPYAMPYM